MDLPVSDLCAGGTVCILRNQTNDGEIAFCLTLPAIGLCTSLPSLALSALVAYHRGMSVPTASGSQVEPFESNALRNPTRAAGQETADSSPLRGFGMTKESAS
jgi:hypothetical protein